MTDRSAGDEMAGPGQARARLSEARSRIAGLVRTREPAERSAELSELQSRLPTLEAAAAAELLADLAPEFAELRPRLEALYVKALAAATLLKETSQQAGWPRDAGLRYLLNFNLPLPADRAFADIPCLEPLDIEAAVRAQLARLRQQLAAL